MMLFSRAILFAAAICGTTMRPLGRWVLFGLIVLILLGLVGHGCHVGGHGDEDLLLPDL